MKKTMRRLLVATLAIASGHLLAADLVGGGHAAPSCGAVICLSPAPGQAPPPECSSWRAPYFSIRVFDPHFDPGKTAKARERYIRTCSQARGSDVSRITGTYGPLYDDPRTY